MKKLDLMVPEVIERRILLITNKEYDILRSQFGTLRWGEHAKYLPFVFTEQGVAILSGVLHSKRAVQVNIEIMRAFVRLRNLLATHKELAQKLNELEQQISRPDSDIQAIVKAIRQLMQPPEKPQRQDCLPAEPSGLPRKRTQIFVQGKKTIEIIQ